MKKNLIMIVLMTMLSFLTFSQTKEQSIKQDTTMYENYWEVQLALNLPELSPEAIQICWIEFDPIEKFNKTFNFEYLNEKLKIAKDEKEKTMWTNLHTEITWNNLFDFVKGSDLYLLTKRGLILSFSSNCNKPKTKKWLISKVIYLDNAPYCYVIAFDPGSKLELNRTNLISLTELYNKIKK